MTPLGFTANIPADIVAPLATADSAMFAAFELCPFTQDIQGVIAAGLRGRR